VDRALGFYSNRLILKTLECRADLLAGVQKAQERITLGLESFGGFP
jgi:hypothetical protein